LSPWRANEITQHNKDKRLSTGAAKADGDQWFEGNSVRCRANRMCDREAPNEEEKLANNLKTIISEA